MTFWTGCSLLVYPFIPLPRCFAKANIPACLPLQLLCIEEADLFAVTKLYRVFLSDGA